MLAVKALEPLAKKDDQALTRLTDALDAAHLGRAQGGARGARNGVRREVAAGRPHRARSKHGDVRAAALARFFERKLLDDPRGAVGDPPPARRRRRGRAEGRVPAVGRVEAATGRRAARARHRTEPPAQRTGEGRQAGGRRARGRRRRKLTPDDYDTLLQATASPALDTCLRGARGARGARRPAGVRAAAATQPRGGRERPASMCAGRSRPSTTSAPSNRLRSLLFDKEPSVRDAAYTALAKTSTRRRCRSPSPG